MVLDSCFNLTSKSNFIYRLWHDLIRFFDHLVVAYFFGHPVVTCPTCAEKIHMRQCCCILLVFVVTVTQPTADWCVAYLPPTFWRWIRTKAPIYPVCFGSCPPAVVSCTHQSALNKSTADTDIDMRFPRKKNEKTHKILDGGNERITNLQCIKYTESKWKNAVRILGVRGRQVLLPLEGPFG